MAKNESDVTQDVAVADIFLGLKDVLPEALYRYMHKGNAGSQQIASSQSKDKSDEEYVLWMRMKWIAKFLIMFYVLQWNAGSPAANGQDLKRFAEAFVEKPDLICVQETWLEPCLHFAIPGYNCLRADRANRAGGECVTFHKQGLQEKSKRNDLCS